TLRSTASSIASTGSDGGRRSTRRVARVLPKRSPVRPFVGVTTRSTRSAARTPKALLDLRDVATRLAGSRRFRRRLEFERRIPFPQDRTLHSLRGQRGGAVDRGATSCRDAGRPSTFANGGRRRPDRRDQGHDAWNATRRSPWVRAQSVGS